MIKKYRLFILCLPLALLMSIYVSGEEWYKGNTHCHTTNSDGDELPHRVVRWYKDHNYNFLMITDHNQLTAIDNLDTDENDEFILIPGDEISDSYKGTSIHLNAINVKKHIPPQRGDSITETLQNNINAIRLEGGIPQINHPNWKWSFTDKEISELNNVKLLEIYNFSYNCNNFGAGGYPGMEEIWDRILSKEILMYGVAVDDAHDYIGEFSPKKSNPGTGWIMVKAPKLDAQSIVKALEQGKFYATNGILIKHIKITDKEYIIEIQAEKEMVYTTTFIGENGTILKEDFNPKAIYAFSGSEIYVRARIFSSSGQFACTQPVFLK